MKALNKQALIAKIKKQTESFDTVVLKEDEANALLDELEAAEKRIAELEARTASVNLPDERVNDAVLNKFCRNSRDLLVCVIARELRAYRDAGIGVKGE